MPTIHAVVLGLIQGITEFLPVSSSAHLVLFQNLFGLKSSELAFDIALHYGTLLAAVIYFRKDLSDIFRQSRLCLNPSQWRHEFQTNQEFRLGIWVVVATIPTGLIGVLFKDQFESMFGSFRDTSLQLIMNAGILWLGLIANRFGESSAAKLGFRSSILIGIAQGIAIVPGISRSGITIVTALLLGISKREAVKFSFLLSIVSIFAAGLLEFRHGFSGSSFSGLEILSGSFAAFAVGYWSIAFLLKKVESGKIHHFAYYCVVVGVLGLALHYGFGI